MRATSSMLSLDRGDCGDLDRQEQRSVGTCSEHVRSERVRNNAETLGAMFAVI